MNKKFKPLYKTQKNKVVSEKKSIKNIRKSEIVVRLNKYIANAGICSRREADELIKKGLISVNGKITKEMGTKVTANDVVEYHGKKLTGEKMVYILLNKPKDCVTTLNDPQKRETVMDHVKNACKERIYPVGRLDRNTTGVLLLTNDGDLAKKLTHPKYNVQKIYEVELNKPLEKKDFIKISEGIMLDDGEIKVDVIAYADNENDKKKIGIEIHSGRNRIIRRIFEQLDYRIIKLDRVMFAGLTKRNIPRGKWRFLTQREVGWLKMAHTPSE